jgi:spermidine/putrescine transport system permease protein
VERALPAHLPGLTRFEAVEGGGALSTPSVDEIVRSGTPLIERRKPSRNKKLAPYELLAPGVLWLAIFFLIPLAFLGYESLQSGLFPNFQFTWQFSNFSDGIRDYHTQLLRSFVYAGIATVACLVLAYPLVYWIAFRAGPWRNLFLLFIVAPFFVTYLVRTLAWLNILADEGPVVGLLRDLHILGPDGRLLATTFAVVSGITYNFFPFMALPLYVSLEQIDARLLEAAKDLYASPIQAFIRVTLPLSAPGIVAGTLLTFIPAAGDFINAALLGTPNQAMIGNVIQSKFLESLDYPSAAALSFILMGLILVALLVYARIVGSERLTG